ncbi:protein DpdH [Micromonospora rubida]|uniref:protein DpdH n=1 Tax=Micromonospora rubida TaxID=2697657 RepID=UPI00137766AB|nr:protein DpdH [Micromonospora rubida]NBE85422.1 hypothetical protein [Micromonospora rubida]
MPEFARYVCWSPNGAANLISTEAVSPSLSVFMATHAPLRIFRAQVDGTHMDDLGRAVDEQKVRNDFLTRKTPNGVLLMPIVGASGTGKSHLVRWIKEQTPSDKRRHVIYLPKLRTSLKAVVSALLEHAEGEQFDALRADVERVTSQIDDVGLQNRLLNQLQEAVIAAPPPDGPARRLVQPDGLGALLLDPHVRQHLLQPHRLIPQLVANLLADRREDQPERPWTFTVDDLPTAIDNPGHASRQAQRLLQIITTRPELQVAAVDLLNQSLSAAVMNATVGVGRLQGALLEIRRLFAKQGKEIVLLIEDFALIQGVQRDLLDAVIEVGERDGVATLAPMRTLMAVTPGYLLQLDQTVLTRARAATPHVYDLGRQFADKDGDQEPLLSFAGRYLNAARLGRDSLDSIAVRTDADVPNACESCEMISACHAGFGKTEQGHGLYPFNRSALIRAVHSRGPSPKPDSVNPRSVLGEVVRNVLVEHAATLRDGQFPSAQFREEYPLSSIDSSLSGAVSRTVEDLDPLDSLRRSLVLEFWGDAPTQVINLPDEIHTAFALPPVAIDPNADDRPGPTVTSKAPGKARTAATGMPSSTVKAMSDIERWLTRNIDLDQGTANEIRLIISEAVSRRCQWVDPIMAEPSAADIKRIWAPKSTTVSIIGAAAENLFGTKDAPIKLKRTASNSEFMQGLLSARSGQIPGNAEHVRRLSEMARSHAPSLVQRVRDDQGTSDAQLILGLRASLIGALLGGQASPTMNDAQLINAVLDDGGGWGLSDRAARSDEWIAVMDRHLQSRSALVSVLRHAFGFRRGTSGAVRLIDVAHLLPLLRLASGDWTWSQVYGSEAPDWVKAGVRGFSQMPVILANQAKMFQSRVERLRQMLPKSTRGRDVVRAVAGALEAGTAIGQVPQDEKEFQRVLAAADGIDWAAIDRLERGLDSWSAADEPQKNNAALLVTGQDHGPSLSQAIHFLELTDTWLTEALAAIAARARVVVSGSDTEIEKVMEEWESIRSRKGQ